MLQGYLETKLQTAHRNSAKFTHFYLHFFKEGMWESVLFLWWQNNGGNAVIRENGADWWFFLLPKATQLNEMFILFIVILLNWHIFILFSFFDEEWENCYGWKWDYSRERRRLVVFSPSQGYPVKLKPWGVKGPGIASCLPHYVHRRMFSQSRWIM